MTLEEIQEIIDEIEFEDLEFFVGLDGERPYLQIHFWTEELENDRDSLQKGRKWMLSPYMTKSEIVQTAFLAVLIASEHEIRENFRYKGRSIFGPHFDVDALAALARSKDNLDMRTGVWVEET